MINLTPDEATALVNRLLDHAKLHEDLSQYDDEQVQFARDLYAAAEIISSLPCELYPNAASPKPCNVIS